VLPIHTNALVGIGTQWMGSTPNPKSPPSNKSYPRDGEHFL
jgi:hypothetical protein